MGDGHQKNVREVLDILERKRAGHRVKDRIGLVVQGGGMRGIYSIGALAALEEMGLGECFDHIGKKGRPLDIKKLKAARTMLHISLTEYSNGKTHYVTNKTPDIDLWEAFRAAAAIPILYNKPVRLGRRLYVDGSLRARLPIRRVVEQGCHYIVIIMTETSSHRANSKSTLFKTISWLPTRHYTEGLRHALFSEDAEYNATKINLSRNHPPIPGVPIKLVLINPQSSLDLAATMTTNHRQLMRSALKGRADTYKAFGKVPPTIESPFSS